ncbi:MAG: hypothetical protein R3190_02360 [Thermoanaerobaculia bacterium]|nr:hypothetical protein [Thermoanaerobaculia bacterium]
MTAREETKGVIEESVGKHEGSRQNRERSVWLAETGRPLTPVEEAFRQRLRSSLAQLEARVDRLDGLAAAVGRRTHRDFLELLGPLRWRAEGLERRVERFFHDDAEGWERIRDEAFTRFRVETEETLLDLARHLRGVEAVFRRRHPARRSG